MASLAEQIKLLVNPEPKSLDPEFDENDVTAAKTVRSGEKEVEEEFLSLPSSALRKNTVPLLEDEDVKYAGKKTSRAELLAARGNNESDQEFLSRESEEQGQVWYKSEDEQETDESFEENAKQSNSSVRQKLVTNSKSEFDKTDNDDDDDDNDDGNEFANDKMTIDESEDEGRDDENSDDDFDDNDDSSNDESDANDMDDDIENNEEEEDHEGFQQFSSNNADDDIEKGLAAKNQISLWDNFLETRIRLQKSLMLVNRLPQFDTFIEFTDAGGNNIADPLKKGNSVVKDLLRNLLLLQEHLLEQNIETKNVLYGGNNKNQDNKIDSDEEIPSDTEDEKEENKSKAELENSRNDPEKETLKIPVKRKHSMSMEEYSEVIAKRHQAFENYRNSTISKWSDKMRLASGKLTSKAFSSFDRSALVQIQRVLSDKERLTKRTQLKRSAYRVLGKPEQNQNVAAPEAVQEQSDAHLKNYDPEIFDDDDFYHQLLRELIERRTNVNNDDPVAMGRQWLELQKLRRKIKKVVDTKASKGRKMRYNIHPKLVNFMAPIETGSATDTYRNELFSSLFGQHQPAEPETSDITIMR